MKKIIIKDEFGNELEVCEAPQDFVNMVLEHRKNTIQAKSEPNHSQEKEIGRFTTKSVSSPNETADSPDTLSTREQIKEELDRDYKEGDIWGKW